MLTENEVVEAVCGYLSRSWKIVSRCETNQRGHDIEARREEVTLRVEAKGGTSSKRGTRRHGKPFTANQVRDHVAKAILVALEVRQDGHRAGIALPDDPLRRHRRVVERVAEVLRRLDIVVFWVDQQGAVRHDPCPWLDAERLDGAATATIR